MYNPLLDAFTPAWREPTSCAFIWHGICERVNDSIERAVRKGNDAKLLYWLNVMDLLDAETYAYWQHQGVYLYAGKAVPPRPSGPRSGGGQAAAEAPDPFANVSIL